jgi:putative FmdB family regulatory protein
MPIYEYQCGACGHTLEKLQKISDGPLSICPVCEAPELEKIISQAGFRLKGTGWYETDFKNSGKKPEPSSQNNAIASDKTSDKQDKTQSSSESSSHPSNVSVSTTQTQSASTGEPS